MRDARTILLVAAALVAVAVFMSLNLRGDVGFALSLRLPRLLALVQVGVAIAVSTVVFQTITGNRILTPSLMGMDHLYILMQTLLVFAFGGFGYAALPQLAKFQLEVLILLAMVCVLFLPILRYSRAMTLMLLTGIVLGVLFRSLSVMIARLIDPNEFSFLQYSSFANFNAPDETILYAGIAVTIIVTVIFWRYRHRLDVLALGREPAICLGINHTRTVVVLLLLVGLLVAASTALVGPLILLGLLIVAVTDRLVRSRSHAEMFVTASLVAITMLVAGQTLLEHGFRRSLALGVLIEFFGGIALLALLTSRRTQ